LISFDPIKLRDRDDIFASILTIAGSGGARKTKIMYSSYLSYSQVVQYLKTLIEKDFLEYGIKDKTFRTTPKGFRFLQIHERIDEMLRIPDIASYDK
jgi:predicted transcriptional regulator